MSGAKIFLWLDDFDDIFSDFDPRPYSARELSDDFLDEVRKIAAEMMSNGHLHSVSLDDY